MTRWPAQSLFHASLRGLGCALLAMVAMVARADMPPADLPTNVIRLASLDWPPFSGPHLDNQGLSTAVVARTLERAGLSLSVEFLPWQRAITMGLRTDGYAGYYPEYRTTALNDGRCLLSDAIGSSPLGFAERADAPVEWRTLADLTGKRIGTVRGYVNTDSFDNAARAGRMEVEPAVDDSTNLRKLAAGRLDLAVIDTNVMAHLLATDPELRPLRDRLRFNPRLLEDKTLHVCFRPGTQGQALLKRFNQVLAQHGPESVMEAARPAMKR